MEPISAAIIGGAGLLGGIFGNRNRVSAEQREAAAAQAAAARAQAGIINQLSDEVRTNLVTRPYSVYGNARVADFVSDQFTGIDRTRALAGNLASRSDIPQAIFDEVNRISSERQPEVMGRTSASMGLAGRGTTLAADLARRFPDQDISSYMNPYLEQVLDPARRDLTRQFDVERNRVNATAARTGSFGGSRNAIAQAQTQRNFGEALSDLEAESRFRAFEDATNRLRQDQQILPQVISETQRQQALAQRAAADELAYGNQRQTTFNNFAANTLAGIAGAATPMLEIGGLQQALDQRRLDAEYATFLEGRDWERNEALTRINALSGAANAGRLPQYTDVPNPTAQGIGAGLGIGSQLARTGIGNWLGKQAESWFGPTGGTSAGTAANSGFGSNLAAAGAGVGAFVDPTFGGTMY